MKLKGLVVGNVGAIVRDGRTLKAMSNRGHFEYPVDVGHPYVDELNNPRRFTYKDNEYKIEYMDGCFYPFVLIT